MRFFIKLGTDNDTPEEPETPDTPPTGNAPLHRGAATEIEEIHQYIYAGGKLLRETISEGSTTKTLDFSYDNVGMPYSLIYNNGTTTTTYYYITNLQGDVMYLVDANGIQVAAYDYDPYGKIITATGDFAEINPLRYRGYYYDSETSFYYLQSRYYDPEICRFINADSYTSTGQGLLGNNMFAYCNNNPICRVDINGCISIWSFKHDRFGIYILWHYLFGNGEDLIINDDEWGDYMRKNKLLSEQIIAAVTPYCANLEYGQSTSVQISLNAEIENGEDIIGYQYLHGTNADVGGFNISGELTKLKNGDVACNLTLTWNDMIDPNYQYASDKKKAEFAKHIPFANPTDYYIQITWQDSFVIPRKNGIFSRGGRSGGGIRGQGNTCILY